VGFLADLHENTYLPYCSIPAYQRVKYSTQELSILLYKPVKQMRSSVCVNEVCVNTHPSKEECTCRQNTFSL